MSGEATQQGWNCSRRFPRIDVSAHCGLGDSVWSAATWSGQSDEDAEMGNGISRNPSGTLDSGQCCRTSVDWRSRMCQMGAKVERCRSPWCTGSLQDDDPKRGRRCSTSHKIDDDAYYDRRTPWGAAVHCGRRRHPGTVAIEFSGETGSDDQFAHEQASSSTSQSSRFHDRHTRANRHDRCDDGIDTSHLQRTTRNSTAISADLASVCDGNHS